MRQPAIGLDRMAGERKIETIEQLGEHLLAESRVLKVGGEEDEVAFGIDANLQGVAEVGGGEQRAENLQMVGQPDIVITQIRNETAARVLQGLVPMDLAFAWSFWKIEETYAAVRRDKFRYKRAARVGNAVADNEQFEVLQGLLLNAGNGVTQGLDMLVRRNQHGRDRHGAELTVRASYCRTRVSKSGSSRSRGSKRGVVEDHWRPRAGSS
jgi:hypothetical protein